MMNLIYCLILIFITVFKFENISAIVTQPPILASRLQSDEQKTVNKLKELHSTLSTRHEWYRYKKKQNTKVHVLSSSNSSSGNVLAESAQSRYNNLRDGESEVVKPITRNEFEKLNPSHLKLPMDTRQGIGTSNQMNQSLIAQYKNATQKLSFTDRIYESVRLLFHFKKNLNSRPNTSLPRGFHYGQNNAVHVRLKRDLTGGDKSTLHLPSGQRITPTKASSANTTSFQHTFKTSTHQPLMSYSSLVFVLGLLAFAVLYSRMWRYKDRWDTMPDPYSQDSEYNLPRFNIKDLLLSKIRNLPVLMRKRWRKEGGVKYVELDLDDQDSSYDEIHLQST